MFIAMTIGFADLNEQNLADILVHDFGELLKGVEAELLKIPADLETSVNTTNTMQSGKILSQIAYLDAFDEVIRTQIL